ncbi:MAG TPA: hypothetical protein VLF91_06440 [Candidatus Saccharimonadales bacterium]|nr:hypothetical protein [Candidatus Saccharimonadales bacterium]
MKELSPPTTLPHTEIGRVSMAEVHAPHGLHDPIMRIFRLAPQIAGPGVENRLVYGEHLRVTGDNPFEHTRQMFLLSSQTPVNGTPKSGWQVAAAQLGTFRADPRAPAVPIYQVFFATTQAMPDGRPGDRGSAMVLFGEHDRIECVVGPEGTLVEFKRRTGDGPEQYSTLDELAPQQINLYNFLYQAAEAMAQTSNQS